MPTVNKVEVRTKRGAIVRMSEVALRIAQKHFGINQPRPATKEVPIELLILPKKKEIIAAIEKTDGPVELPVTEPPAVKVTKKRKKDA